MNASCNPHTGALICYDCGRPYGGDGWIEAVIPDGIWKQISPTGDSGGLLCIQCMAGRCVAAGLCDVPVMLASGPFAQTLYQPKENTAVTPKKTAKDKAWEVFDVLFEHLDRTGEIINDLDDDALAELRKSWNRRFADLCGDNDEEHAS